MVSGIRKTHASIVNLEMLIGLIAVMTSPVMMIAFNKYGYLFTFNIDIDHEWMIINALLLLFCEIVMNVASSLFEIFYHGIDLLQSWKELFNKRLIIFITYGHCAMGIMGMLYVCLLLLRAVFCKQYNILTCTYSPI